jgi:hypothetical protein
MLCTSLPGSPRIVQTARCVELDVGQEIQLGLTEVGEMATVEALDIKDRVQHKPFIRKYMPFGIPARLAIDQAVEGLDLGIRRCRSTVAQARRQQVANDDVVIFIVIFSNVSRLVEDEIRVVIFLCNGNFDFPTAKIRDPVKTRK